MNRLLLIALLLLLAVFTTACSEDKSSAGLAENEMVPASGYAPVSGVPVSGNHIYSRPAACDFRHSKTKVRYVDAKLHKVMGKCNSSSNRYAGWAERPEKPAVIIKWLKSYCKRKYKSTATIIDVDERQCHSGSGAYNVAAVGYVNKYKDVLRAFKSRRDTELSKSAWGKEHYCKTGRKKGRTYPGLSAKTCGSSSPCRNCTGSSEGGGTPTSGGYQFLNKHNAYALSGRTVRWKAKTIQVSGAKGAWRTAVNRWQAGIGIKFKYVKKKPAKGKGIQIVGYANIGKDFCGKASGWWWDDGEIGECKVRVNSKHDNMPCGTVARTITHEVGHCIGVFKHIKGPGLMDKTGSINTITTPVRNMLKLLYSLPPGTNIKSKLKGSSTALQRTKESKYDPDGRQRIYFEFGILKGGITKVIRSD